MPFVGMDEDEALVVGMILHSDALGMGEGDGVGKVFGVLLTDAVGLARLATPTLTGRERKEEEGREADEKSTEVRHGIRLG